jgi:hypothetical protein
MKPLLLAPVPYLPFVKQCSNVTGYGYAGIFFIRLNKMDGHLNSKSTRPCFGSRYIQL